MRKIIIAVVLAALLGIAFITPALAGNGGQPDPNDNAWWGQAHKDTHQFYNDKDTEYYDPNIIGDVFSYRIFNNGESGKKGIDPPPWGPGGIKENWPY